MILSTLPRLAAVLEQADCFGPVSEELVAEVERQYGLSFPADYRTFLLKFGAALMPGLEVFGLVPSYGDGEPPIWSDLRPLLHRRRDELPTAWVPISDDGGDYRFYLSCATGSGCGEVLVNGPGVDAVPVSAGFVEFLERAVGLGVRALVPA